MKKPSILIYFDDFFFGGGVDRVTILLSNYFVAHGLDVVIAGNEIGPQVATCGIDPRVRIERLPLKSGPLANKPYNLDLLESYIRENKIDLFMNQGFSSRVISRFTNDQQHIMIDVLHGMPFSEKYNTPPLHLSRGKTMFVKRINYYKKNILSKIALWRRIPRIKRHYAFHYENSDTMVLLCPAYRAPVEKMVGANRGVGSNIRIITNPLGRLDSPNLEKKKQVLYVGRLEFSAKRVDRLLRIWKMVERKNSDWELLIVGDGDDRASLESLSAKLGLERIRFEGSTLDPWKYYKDGAIICQTSTHEGLSCVLMEAQQAGTVPIAFDSNEGTKSIITHGKDGVLVKSFDLDKFAKELLNLINSPEQLQELSLNGIERSHQYDVDVVGSQWLALFRELGVEIPQT